eukprot:scaffold182405_cov29-Tisochrysis_lutea.AAC.8
MVERQARGAPLATTATKGMTDKLDVWCRKRPARITSKSQSPALCSGSPLWRLHCRLRELCVVRLRHKAYVHLIL